MYQKKYKVVFAQFREAAVNGVSSSCKFSLDIH